MKVKPFYIQITDDMTPQMVQDAFDKCVDAGAVAANGCKGVMSKFHYQGNFDVSLYSVFGVNAGFGTYIEESSDYFDDNAQEITLDQLDEWLGLEAEQEWKYGDKAEWTGVEFIYVARHPAKPDRSVCIHSGHGSAYSILTSELKRPETPQQREERERDEAIKIIQRDMAFSGSDYYAAKRLYDKGYRKAK